MDNKNSFGINLKALIKRAGITQKQLADDIDVTNQTITNWVKGYVAVPKEQRIRDLLCSALSATEQELFGYSDGYASTNKTLGAPIKGSYEAAYLPYLGYAHAGEFEDPATIEGAMVEVPKSVADNHPMGRVVKVEGDCVNRVIPNDSIAVLDPTVEPNNGSIVCVSLDDQDFILRRIYRGANKLMLSPDSFSDEYEDIIFDDPESHDVNLVGVVVWFQAEKEME